MMQSRKNEFLTWYRLAEALVRVDVLSRQGWCTENDVCKHPLKGVNKTLIYFCILRDLRSILSMVFFVCTCSHVRI